MATILVVDDEPSIRFLLRTVFELEDHGVEEAPHGGIALERARAARPDLVVTNVMMPVMDGRQLVQRLRADPSTAGIPILVVSARAGSIEGVDAVLGKPFRAEDVIERAHKLLGVAA